MRTWRARSERCPATATPPPSEREATTQPAEPTTALFFGDSHIVGGGYTGPQSSMAAIAAHRLGRRVRLRGGGGTGVVSGNPDYGVPSFLAQIRDGALDVGPVDWLVVEGGGNDKVDAQHWLEGRPELVGPEYDHPLPAGHRLCGRKLAKALRALDG